MWLRKFKNIAKVTSFSLGPNDPGSGPWAGPGPSCSYDLLVGLESLSPDQYFKGGGAGLMLHYAVLGSPFGPVLLCELAGNLVSLAFLDPGGAAEGLEELKLRWPGARFLQDPARLEVFREGIAWSMGGGVPIYHPRLWREAPVLFEGDFQGYGDLPGALGEGGETAGQLVVSLGRSGQRWFLTRFAGT